MNGELAQLVCLATYGGRWLAAPDRERPPDPQRGNSTFRYVSPVRFDRGTRWTDVPSWLEGLRDRGARSLWLHLDPAPGGDLPPHVAVAFANGGPGWGLLARMDTGHELWRVRWRPGGGPSAAVDYVATAAHDATDLRPPPSLDDAEAALRAVLDEAESAARELGEAHWADWFAGARSAADFRFHPDLVPPDFPDRRRRLAVLAENAFVFGGMGSWNDGPGGDHPVSPRLFDAILQAFAAAVNYSKRGSVAAPRAGGDPATPAVDRCGGGS